MPTVQRAKRDWWKSFSRLLQTAKSSLVICSPFVAHEGTRFLAENTSKSFHTRGQITFLTNLSIANVCQLATDPRALTALIAVIPSTALIHLPGLHAKVYVADDERAIVTSANLTAGGLYRNLEYGIEIDDASVVRGIKTDLIAYAQLGASVPQEQLVRYAEAVDRLHVSLVREQLAARVSLRERFRESLGMIEDDLLRLRLAGGAVHTVFAKTVEYLLRTHGALATVDLHPMIASIHPDFCDDSIDRVIDGKRFGKKWKHAVRTAQQQLKSQGAIAYENGVWRLAERG